MTRSSGTAGNATAPPDIGDIGVRIASHSAIDGGGNLIMCLALRYCEANTLGYRSCLSLLNRSEHVTEHL